MRKPFVAGNWKMHGSKTFVSELIAGLNEQSKQLGFVDVAICPPAIYIDSVQQSLTAENICLGAQNMAEEPLQGAYTGEISAQMLKDFDCEYVILGHSERRSLFGETDSIVALKVKVALESGLKPILCVGETLEEREAGQVEKVISNQLHSVLEMVGIEGFKHIVVAYEPVWAIGTGKTASSNQAQEVHAFIRKQLAVLDESIANEVIIQYGGSVKPENAAELFSQPDIDGGLIGGASLKASDFISICEAAGAAK